MKNIMSTPKIRHIIYKLSIFNTIRMKKLNLLSNYLLFRLLAVLCIILILFIFFLKYEFSLEKNKNLELEREIINLNSEIQLLENNLSNLNNNINSLNSKISILLNNNSELEQNLTFAKKLISENELSLIKYEEKIQTSMNWFKENSILNNSNIIQKNIEQNTYDKCVIENQYTCNINLGCFVMTEKNELNYYLDNISELGQEDKLYSIQEFLEKKGGDCEDFSLFYKAQFNSMLNRCKDKSIVFTTYSKKFESWKKEDFSLDTDEKWYLPNIYIHNFENITNSYVVFGDMYDLNSNTINGHCMIALTNKSINNINDLYILKGSFLIEPQTGEYEGIINGNSDIFLIENGEDIESYYSSIWAVISNEDYYLYDYEKELKWYSYGSIKEEISIN